MKIYIYEAKNKTNGKLYYGQTSLSLEERKHAHLNESKVVRLQHLPFKRAIKKYTIDGFDWRIVEECETQEQANLRESYYIENFGNYNVAPGGIGGKIKLSKKQETARIEKILKTKSKWSKEYKDEVYNFTRTEKFKNDVSKRVSGNGNFWYGKSGYWSGKSNPEQSKRMLGKMIGPMSENTKKKISDARKGKQYQKRSTYTLKNIDTREERCYRRLSGR